jgi:hypothetical protein
MNIVTHYCVLLWASLFNIPFWFTHPLYFILVHTANMGTEIFTGRNFWCTTRSKNNNGLMGFIVSLHFIFYNIRPGRAWGVSDYETLYYITRSPIDSFNLIYWLWFPVLFLFIYYVFYLSVVSCFGFEAILKPKTKHKITHNGGHTNLERVNKN